MDDLFFTPSISISQTVLNSHFTLILPTRNSEPKRDLVEIRPQNPVVQICYALIFNYTYFAYHIVKCFQLIISYILYKVPGITLCIVRY